MRLGQLIRQLELGDPEAEIEFDFPQALPTFFSSYRGYYDQLALGHGQFSYNTDWKHPTVGSLLAAARAANGTVFHGWKGGEFQMDLDTKVWVDNPGHCNSVEIFSIEHGGYRSVIHTRKINN